MKLENGFITNSTAYSTAAICKEYLNGCFTSPEVSKLREVYRINNLIDKKFTVQELLSALENQAAYLIDLFINNRLQKFLEEKELEATEKNDQDAIWLYSNLRSQYNRRIYHTSSSCESMFQDYDEEGAFFKNTGMFSASVIRRDYYILKIEFLFKLGLRQCNKCSFEEDKLKAIFRKEELEKKIRAASSPEFWELRIRELEENWKNLSEEDMQLGQKELEKFQQALSERHTGKSLANCNLIGFKKYEGGVSLLLSTGCIVFITPLINNKNSYRVMQKQFNILEFRG